MKPDTLSAALLSAFAAAAIAQPGLVVFVHDQSSDTILRLEDLNGDGDAHDPGEVTLFFDDSTPVTGVDNAQGIVALDGRTLLATDNFSPQNVVLLRDLDGNGDAFGAGENTVWFDGQLPGGVTLNNPVELRLRNDGSFFLLDNNIDNERQDTVYLLADLDGTGDASGPDEVSEVVVFPPLGGREAATLDVLEGADGMLYTLDINDEDNIESIDIVDPKTGTRVEWLSSQTLYNLNEYLLTLTAEMALIPASQEIIFNARLLNGTQAILAAGDRNGSGRIEAASEIRVLWNETTHADGFDTGAPRDFWRLSDGSLLWPDAVRDRVMLMRDLNADGDYQDAGETTVFYDSATALANGLPTLSQPLSVTAAEPCRADLAEPFGQLNFFDLTAYLALFNAGDPGADLTAPFGELNFFDLTAYLLSYNAGCP